MQRWLNRYQATGAEIMLPYYFGLMADVYWLMGQEEEAFRLIEEALSAVQKSGECWWEAELHRLKGEFSLNQRSSQAPDSAREGAAEDCFSKALRVASDLGAKSLELRAAMSLSRLRGSQGRATEGRQTLAKVYGWFTEGLDVADLQEARTLLAM